MTITEGACAQSDALRYTATVTEGKEKLAAFQARIGHEFRDEALLSRALTHKSFSHESKNRDAPDNETFEFLGDSVLGFVIGDALFRRFPSMDEGALSKMKAYLVSAPILARKARTYGMGDVLRLGIGEEKSGGRNKDSLLANVFEAMVAALYLDGDLGAARKIIEDAFAADLEAIDANDLLFHDFKTALQEVAQGRGLALPEYAVVDEIGPDHEKTFIVEVRMGGQVLARGSGSSKKEAQQKAACEALRHQQTAQQAEDAPKSG